MTEENSDVTHEFFTPHLGIELQPYLDQEIEIGIHHLGRYHWAKEVLARHFADASQMRVLDIACGMGYGSYILADSLEQADVLGADYDALAIKMARESYERSNLSFDEGNLITWERGTRETAQSLGTFDAIVSFDTLEHLLHREIALMRVTQNLAEDGLFLFSTPCGHESSLLNPEWEHHKIEYSHRDLRNFLGRFFGKVLVPEDGALPNIEFWDDVINGDKPRYLNLSNPVVCTEPIRL